MSPARPWTWTTWSGDKCSNHEANAPPTSHWCCINVCLFKKIVKSKMADTRWQVKWGCLFSYDTITKKRVSSYRVSSELFAQWTFISLCFNRTKTQGEGLHPSFQPLVTRWGYEFACTSEGWNYTNYMLMIDLSRHQGVNTKRIWMRINNIANDRHFVFFFKTGCAALL